MLDEATSPNRRFDIICVHAFSRFYRNGAEMELTIRKLRKHGVEVVSVTQPTGDDPSQEMMRQMIGIFDEYTSRENGKNVIRAMRESARQGFWNGTTPPLGYRIVEAERRGTKVKKRLEIDPVEAELVRLIFRLYADGDGRSAPLGVKETTKWLNEHGYRTRRGATFGVGPLHRILKSSYYAAGKWPYGRRNSRTGGLHDPASIVEIEIPPIITHELLEKVHARLARNNPKVTPPRVVNGPTLLTGLATCASCGAGMTRTGTRRRNRSYTYYSCAGCHQKGKSVCLGRHVPMAKLDGLVIENVRSVCSRRNASPESFDLF
jgi:site-specific DNA recombinase